MVKENRKSQELWKQDPEDGDFVGAFDFLSLLMPPEMADRLVDGLRNAHSTKRKV